MSCSCSKNKCSVQYTKSDKAATITNPIQYLENNRDLNNIFVYSPYPVLAFPAQSIAFSSSVGAVLYAYINLPDILDVKKTLIFNKVKMFLANTTNIPINTNISVAIYKLITPGGVLGDSATYPANSEKISETNTLTLTENGFFDLTFLNTINLNVLNVTTENHYFFALLVNGSASITLLQGSSPGSSSRPGGYAYRSTSSSITSLPDNMLSDLGINNYIIPYYTLYKS